MKVEYGVDATEYLLKIHELLYPINNKIKIVYFCWNERKEIIKLSNIFLLILKNIGEK